MVFKLYSWHKCKFEKARKYAVSGKLDVLYLYIFSAIFSFIFCDCPLRDFKGGGSFLQNMAKVITLWQKYNLTEGRNIKMGIVAIRYYNVWFYLHLQSESDVVKFSYLSKRIEAGDGFRMRDIHKWCAMQKIK